MKILLLLAIQFFQPSVEDSLKEKLITLSSEKIVPVYTADTRANRLSFQRNFDENSYTASMGGIFPIININKGKFRSQFSAAGSTYLTLLRANNAGSVQNIDFFADLFFDFHITKNWIARIGTGHSSQHLSDDAIIAGNPFKNYAKDYHQVMLNYQGKNHRFLSYGGMSYNYNFKTNSDISNQVLLQFGFEHYPFKKERNYLRNFYYAGDIKLRQELDFDQTLNFQFGYKINYPQKRALRMALDYTSGVDERGYYQPSLRNFAHFGIYFDF